MCIYIYIYIYTYIYIYICIYGRFGEVEKTLPTNGFNVETIECACDM